MEWKTIRSTYYSDQLVLCNLLAIEVSDAIRPEQTVSVAVNLVNTSLPVRSEYKLNNSNNKKNTAQILAHRCHWKARAIHLRTHTITHCKHYSLYVSPYLCVSCRSIRLLFTDGQLLNLFHVLVLEYARCTAASIVILGSHWQEYVAAVGFPSSGGGRRWGHRGVHRRQAWSISGTDVFQSYIVSGDLQFNTEYSQRYPLLDATRGFMGRAFSPRIPRMFAAGRAFTVGYLLQAWGVWLLPYV